MAKKSRPKRQKTNEIKEKIQSMKVRETTGIEPKREKWGLFLEINTLKALGLSPKQSLLLDTMFGYKDLDNYLEVKDSIYFSIARKDIYEVFNTYFNGITYSNLDLIIHEVIDLGYIEQAISYFIYNGNKCDRRFYKFTEKFKTLLYDQTDGELC